MTAMATGEVRTVVVDGIPMRWEEHGAGTPVVLVHGIPTGPRLWRDVIPKVDGARLLAWEMVGYAGSIPAGTDRDISVARQAEYLVRWLDTLRIERAVFGGHDLGAGVVQIAAVRHPERCAGILITNGIGYDSWPIPSVKLLRALGPVVRRLPSWTVKSGVFRMLMSRGHDDGRIARESLAVHWKPYAAHGAGGALVRQIRALDVNDTLAVAPELPRLRGIPARVVWGDADQFQKVEYGDRFARDLGTTLERIEGGKHFTPEDHPDRIAAALRALVSEVDARRPPAIGAHMEAP
ncbi:MAG: alpha/beta fold hydrolase [Gemmatimonadaceae bacterium]